MFGDGHAEFAWRVVADEVFPHVAAYMPVADDCVLGYGDNDLRTRSVQRTMSSPTGLLGDSPL